MLSGQADSGAEVTVPSELPTSLERDPDGCREDSEESQRCVEWRHRHGTGDRARDVFEVARVLEFCVAVERRAFGQYHRFVELLGVSEPATTQLLIPGAQPQLPRPSLPTNRHRWPQDLRLAPRYVRSSKKCIPPRYRSIQRPPDNADPCGPLMSSSPTRIPASKRTARTRELGSDRAPARGLHRRPLRRRI